ncbi:hypothetical protein [Variovorax sp. PBL-E5]|uniref:hypothetical protein n=1 Tax=Variovorax sp. PBL-E5 TaxID=434014 RepID=UPI0013A56E8E|nr:hypothetical protein [Variovorax sp. PBL-E5]
MAEIEPKESLPADPVSVPLEPISDTKVAGELSTFNTDGRKLDVNLRRASGYAALVIAGLLYVAGLGAIAVFMGLVPKIPAASNDHWHLVVAAVAALFSVPTVLLLAVLRSTGNFQKDAGVDSIHEAVGKKVMGVLEKWLTPEK